MSASIWGSFKKKFITGLFVSIPAVITVLLIVQFFRLADGPLEPLYYRILGYHTVGLGFITSIILVFLVGIVASNMIGRKIIGYFENLFLKLPVFKGFYTAIKQLVDAFSPDNKSASFKKFVVIEYPRKGSFAFGFLTKECTTKVENNGRETCLRAVYVPTNNLYLGEIVLVLEEDIFYTDIPIDEGIKIILSGGIAAPNSIREAGG